MLCAREVVFMVNGVPISSTALVQFVLEGQPLNSVFQECLALLHSLSANRSAELSISQLINWLCRCTSSKLSDEMLALASLVNVDPALLVKHSSQMRMAECLRQVRCVPNDIILNDKDKIEHIGFGWAPKSLIRRELPFAVDITAGAEGT